MPENDAKRQTGLLRGVAKRGFSKAGEWLIFILIASLVVFLLNAIGGAVGISLKEVNGVIVIVQNTNVPVTSVTSIPVPTAIPIPPTDVSVVVVPTNVPIPTQVPIVAIPTVVSYEQTNSSCPQVNVSKWLFDLVQSVIVTDTANDGSGETIYGYGTGHMLALLDNGNVEIGVLHNPLDLYSYVTEDVIDPTQLPFATWTNVHQFVTGDGAFALCRDNSSLYVALVPYNSFT